MRDLICCSSKLELCTYSKRLINKIAFMNQSSITPVDLTAVNKAIYYAKKYHKNQRRLTGEPYYTHPLAVAYMVAEYQFQTEAIVTSILHDTIEDTKLTKEHIKLIFGDNVANQVADLSKIKPALALKLSSQELINLLLQQDQNSLLLIKYFDRLHNMQTIRIKEARKRKQIIQETLQVFLGLGVYLNIDLKLQHKLFKLCKIN